ncbi:MAG: HNH endonuclease [Candidatus Latescibacterota bacterium]|nr:MAG: HNH endonuclease [Candidatus Latescibacterota bacterium]
MDQRTTAAIIPHDALQTDRILGRLARLRHQITLPLACAASGLVRRRGWIEFGYRNDHDFAREVLGWSARTLRNLAALDKPLREFPELVRAVTGVDGKPPLGRSAVLLIAPVATRQDIEMWIERARTCTVRQLGEFVHATRRTGDADQDSPCDAASAASGSDDAGPADVTPAPDVAASPAEMPARQLGECTPGSDDEPVIFRIAMPPEMHMALDEIEELHHAAAGYDAPIVGFLEDMLGEVVASGRWAPDPAQTAPGRFKPARRSAGGSRPKACTRQLPRTPQHASTQSLSSGTTEGKLALRLLRECSYDLRDLARVTRQLRAIDEGNMRGEDGGDAGANDPHRGARDALLGPNPGPTVHGRIWQLREIVRILSNLVRYENQIEIRMAALLLEQHERRVWRELGYRGLEDYAEERLAWRSSVARRRVDVARSLRRLPIVRRAFESGRIGLERTHWIVQQSRNVQLTPQKQQEWIGHVAPTTVKRLRDEQRILKRQRLEHHAAVARVVTLRHGTHRKPAPDALATRVAAAEVTASRFPALPDDAAWMQSLERVPGRTRERILELEGSLLERTLARGAMLETPRVLIVPRWLARDLLDCVSTLREGVCKEAVTPHAIADEVRTLLSVRIAAACLEQNEQSRTCVRNSVPLWLGLLAALELCVMEWDDPSRKTASRRLQAKVTERDGCRCTLPGCTSRRHLEVNHVRELGRGGSNAEHNLHAVCAPHHRLCIHGGRARVRGRAPLEIVWRIGRAELAQWFRNERRVPADSVHGSASLG